MRFDTFDQVVSWYERTKPMISKNHTASHDVRPIGDRQRKWERIKRIDENTYALLDGNYGNTIWGTQYAPEHAEWENTMAPITWMRREDGDFIRIRNHTKNGCTVTRYNFLQYNLPTSMMFQYNQQGKHWVKARVESGYEEFALPKCKVRFDHGTKQLQDDNIFLMFKVNGDGTFTRVGDKLSVEVQKVDKELKKQWRERLDTFYNYCAAIAPMIDVSWSGKNDYANMLREFEIVPGANLGGVWIRDSRSVPTGLVRQIITQEDHPMRVAFAALVIADIKGKRVIESQDDVRDIKAAYNRVMNKALGFYKIEEK
jgi:hypothetical protein